MVRVMTDDKPYRECVAEIVGVLKKYDMAGAITVVSKERCMFKFHFPTWSCVFLGEDQIRFRAKSEDFPSKDAQRETVELSTHIVLQMRDQAARTFQTMEGIYKALVEKFEIEHHAGSDFDPEREN